jgi:two-component system phosphate regulon sensor histidine kinase PhoR
VRPYRGGFGVAESLPIVTGQAELVVLDHIPDPVILLGAQREVIFANRAAMDLLQASYRNRDLAQSLRHPAVLEIADAVLRGAPERSAEVDLLLPVQRFLLVRAIAVPGNGPTRAMLTFHDMTDSRQLEQIRQDFVANVSHELRSPISAIVGFIETLRGPAREDAAARERFLEIMADEASRMSRLIDNLLSLSRVEATEHVRPRELVDIGAILGTVRDLLSRRAQERQMELRLELEANLPSIPGNRDELTEVFHNLIDNAIKYGRVGTPIRVAVQSIERIPDIGGTGLAISVENQGDGIEAEHIPRLTERFYRIDRGRSRKMGGTGLGLAIVKHIVNHHRGRLAIESTVGVGARFTVYLPGPR